MRDQGSIEEPILCLGEAVVDLVCESELRSPAEADSFHPHFGGALVFGSNTLVGEPERELTNEARRLALERGIPVFFDPNIRPNRWRDLDRAFELCREATKGAFVVRANLEEARQVAGVARRGWAPAAVAEALVEACEAGAGACASWGAFR